MFSKDRNPLGERSYLGSTEQLMLYIQMGQVEVAATIVIKFRIYVVS